MKQDTPRPGVGVYVGLLLVTLTTLAYQLLLTRIFSVTMWYHYSFMAISVTMFGMTVGAILVYLQPKRFPAATAAQSMGITAACFSGLVVCSFLLHLQMEFTPDIEFEESLDSLWPLLFNFGLISLPFVASGMCVTIALTRFPQHVGRLYAVDLIGAGLGCLLVAVVARWIDAPTLVLDVGTLAMFGAMCCLTNGDAKQLPWLGLGLVLIAVVLVWLNAAPLSGRTPLVRARWVKGTVEPTPIFERWNAFSRVSIWGAGSTPIGWGLSSRMPPTDGLRQKWLNIDAGAGTVITGFEGDLSQLEYLRYDVTNFVHHVRDDARVLVIGSGGGRDVLAALVFRQAKVVGVEVNDTILEAVNGQLGEFSGHLDRRDDVSFVNDEARSYLARTDQQFDVIQVSLIDTWAATAAGAFVLAENGLYTIEAWQRMMRRLSDRGVIAFNRWYSTQNPYEVYRLTSLAVATLRRLGVDKPADHLAIVYCPQDLGKDNPTGMATLLASRSPFSAEDVAALQRVTAEMDFRLLLSPKGTPDTTLRRLVSGKDFDAFVRDFPTDISPPTDDRPFFFDMLRLRDVLTFNEPKDQALAANMDAITILGQLLLAVVFLTALCVILPLCLTLKRQTLSGSLPLLIYFSSIGLGFMLVEIALIQRFSVFLGHPIYSMTVVLFCLLSASGCGSWLSGRIVKDTACGPRAPLCLLAIVGAVLLVGLVVVPQLPQWDGLPTPGRIAVAVAALAPLGLAMGMGFPLGMRAASRRSEGLTPWLFGVNGALSICGSVLAVVVSLCLGITVVLLAGVACYGGACLSFLWARQVP